MAKSRRAGSARSRPLALELLEADHRKVATLFDRYEDEIFEAIADMQEELDELGQEMAARKADLMEETGRAEQEEAMQVAPRGPRSKSKAGEGARGTR